MTKNYPELLLNLKASRLKKVIDCGHIMASPVRAKNGSRILFIKAG